MRLMRDWLLRFDDFLIDRGIDPFIAWFFIRFGRTCFWLEKLILTMSVAAHVVWTILIVFEIMMRAVPSASDTMLVSFYTLFSFIIVCIGKMISKEIDQREVRMRQGWINEIRIKRPYERIWTLGISAVVIGWMILIPFRISNIFIISYFALLTAQRFLAAATPPPPDQIRSEIPAGVEPALR
jgi:hypothetical protein